MLGSASAGHRSTKPEKNIQFAAVGASGNSATLVAHSKDVVSAQWTSAGTYLVQLTGNIFGCVFTTSVLGGQASPGYAMTIYGTNATSVKVQTARPDGTLEHRSFFLVVTCPK
jgi:hypothetical protein